MQVQLEPETTKLQDNKASRLNVTEIYNGSELTWKRNETPAKKMDEAVTKLLWVLLKISI